VVTTLYGLLLANLVLAPIARAVSRAASVEETGRQEVIDWIAAQLSAAPPERRRPPVELEAA
jgi:chemotaxis protein MotA